MKNNKQKHISIKGLSIRQIKMLILAASLTTMSGCAITPLEFSKAENITRGEVDSQQIYASQDPITGPIDIHEAIARALRYNLADRVKLAELAVANYQVDVDLWDLIPPLETNTGVTSRSNVNASSSQSISTGLQSLEPSTSIEDSFRTFDLRMAFNVLDFGVTYLRARQSGNQILIAKERQRSTAQSIIRDVRSLYWNAVAAERGIVAFAPQEERVQEALSNAKKTSEQGLRTPLAALRFQRELMDVREQLQDLRISVAAPKLELARLMNLRPDQDFELVIPDRDSLTVPELNATPAQLEAQALEARPELRESAYLSRISADETRKTMVRLLPGIEIAGGYDVNSNRFLANQNWATYSASVTWNIINLFSGPSQIGHSEASEDVVKMQRLALTAAIITQVHVSAAAYKETVKAYKLAEERSNIEAEIFRHVKAIGPTEKGGELEVIQAQLDAGMAAFRSDLAYAGLQTAYAGVQQAIAADQLPEKLTSTDIKSVAASLRDRQQKQDLLKLSTSISDNTEITEDTVQ